MLLHCGLCRISNETYLLSEGKFADNALLSQICIGKYPHENVIDYFWIEAKKMDEEVSQKL